MKSSDILAIVIGAIVGIVFLSVFNLYEKAQGPTIAAEQKKAWEQQIAECKQFNGILYLKPYSGGGSEWEVERCILGSK